MKRWLVLLVLLWPGLGQAHPGRLNAEGCHHVRKDFVYKSGKVAPKGQYHCHRAAIGQPMKLDGLEVLMDDPRDVQDDKDDDVDQKKGKP